MHCITPHSYAGGTMFHYDFSIAGLLLRVNSQFQLNDLHELAHFQIEYCLSIQPDVVYDLQLLPDNWTICGDEVLADRQNAIYHWQGEEHRYYYWNMFSQERFVLVRCDLKDPCKRTIYLKQDDLARMMPEFRLSAFLSIERPLLQNKGFFLHSSLIDWHGSGILFSAPSGTGKSTQAALWERLEGAQILNGDRSVIRHYGGRFYAYGSPYAGTSGIYVNASVPIRAIVVLSQAPENTIERLSPTAAFQQLYRECTILSWDASFVNDVLELLTKLIATVPVYHLSCRPDADAVKTLKEILN